MSYSCKTLEILLKEPGHVCFFEVDKACKEVFVIFSRLLKDLLQSDDLIRGAAT